ncbi:uncharacterized protein LOC119638038 [Glossina fuscipes]|uniref:Uncharacterized protein LOC119638038 n=1 Tax=Glossina fuscipes TaxID=7396 RepID=A0A9C5YWS6_9MUSC|nr:uncharacterized protein LOC119638038 [Glossina fuscipes]
MVNTCIVLTCRYSSVKYGPKRSLLKIPENKVDDWLRILNLSYLNRKLYHICTHHFVPKYIKRCNSRCKFTKNAIPTLHLGTRETESNMLSSIAESSLQICPNRLTPNGLIEMEIAKPASTGCDISSISEYITMNIVKEEPQVNFLTEHEPMTSIKEEHAKNFLTEHEPITFIKEEYQENILTEDEPITSIKEEYEENLLKADEPIALIKEESQEFFLTKNELITSMKKKHQENHVTEDESIASTQEESRKNVLKKDRPIAFVKEESQKYFLTEEESIPFIKEDHQDVFSEKIILAKRSKFPKNEKKRIESCREMAGCKAKSSVEVESYQQCLTIKLM